MTVLVYILLFVAQFLAIVLLASNNLFEINSDLVSYIQIARHYMRGDTELGVSGYWGPLTSWLLIPFLYVFDHPLLATRCLMVLVGVLFLQGVWYLIRQAELSPAGVMIVTGLAAVLTLPLFAFTLVLPDILLSALLFFAVGCNLSPSWLSRKKIQLLSGMLYGAAYLAKSVGLPLGVLIILMVCALYVYAREETVRRLLKPGLWTLTGLLLVAGPWILVLSLKYGHFEFSSSARFSRSLYHPSQIQGIFTPHPTFRTFHVPERGRITSWEDPSVMDYAFWSPLENLDYAKHQCMIVASNISEHKTIWSFSIAVLLLLLLYKQRGARISKSLWIGSFASINALIYVSTYAEDVRYYLPAAVFLLIAVFGVLWESELPKHLNKAVRLGVEGLRMVVLIYLLLVLPCQMLMRLPRLLNPSRYDDMRFWHEAIVGQELAAILSAHGYSGPVAGGGITGLYLAFFIQQPWYGHESSTSKDRILASGARLFVASKNEKNRSLLVELEQDARFQNIAHIIEGLDPVLTRYPVQVFSLKRTDF